MSTRLTYPPPWIPLNTVETPPFPKTPAYASTSGYRLLAEAFHSRVGQNRQDRDERVGVDERDEIACSWYRGLWVGWGRR